jgi:hypothetical protein
MSLINMAAYNGTLFIWLAYTFAKSPARETSSILLRPQRWEQSISDIQHPLPADSLIPMFEGMVDRALSRTQSPPFAKEHDTGAARPAVGPIKNIRVSGLPATADSKTGG